MSLENIVPLLEEGEASSDTETLGQEFYDRVAVAVSERIKQCGPRVPVVTGVSPSSPTARSVNHSFILAGFFGPVPGSLLRQVGRGYTDLLAALLAAGLGASELQIWKEVDGIFTADPRKVPTARLIPIISPEEAAELTYYGSEVVHPFTMEQVRRALLSHLSPSGFTTLRTGHQKENTHPDKKCGESTGRGDGHPPRPGHRRSLIPERRVGEPSLSGVCILQAVRRAYALGPCEPQAPDGSDHQGADRRAERELEPQKRIARVPCGDLRDARPVWRCRRPD